MDWISYINYAVVAVTLFFGALGWLMPGYTMDTVDLRDTGSTMGRSEVRAASGALFVIAALGALLPQSRQPERDAGEDDQHCHQQHGAADVRQCGDVDVPHRRPRRRDTLHHE